jgi:hypothetical protein
MEQHDCELAADLGWRFCPYCGREVELIEPLSSEEQTWIEQRKELVLTRDDGPDSPGFKCLALFEDAEDGSRRAIRDVRLIRQLEES